MTYIEIETGVKIAVDDINPNGKKTMVMIHGWPFSQRMFEYQKALLPKLGFRVVTFDLRGFGHSDTPVDGYSYMSMATDVFTVIKNLGLNDFILAGFSLGGAIAIRYMSMYNGYGVKKLVLMAAAAPCFVKNPDCTYGMNVEELNEIIDQGYKDRPHMIGKFLDKMFALPHSVEIKEWLKGICYEASCIGTVEAAIALRDEDLSPDLRLIHVPTAIFHGKKDLICPYEYAKLVHQSIGGSELITFEDCGHGIFYDNLDDFNKRLISFIN